MDELSQILERLSLIHFKNYEEAEWRFCQKLNCLVGRNGAGKTNILDAIYYLAMTKSCFNSADSQNIRYGDEFFVIQGEYTRKGEPENIYCGVKRGQKKVFRRNKKDYERMSEHIGLLPTVMISPADSQLLLGGSDERRRFMNEVISQFDHGYLDTVMRYNRALEQRNSLLKRFADGQPFDSDMLEVWNEQLMNAGTSIYKTRSDFCTALIPVFQEFYEHISGGHEKVELIYRSHLQDADFAALIRETCVKDRALQYTTCGIHRDDLLLQMDGHPIKRSGSQGQQKTYLVALKLANAEFIRRHCGIKPVLLLDDIFDKFDAERVAHIVTLTAGEGFGQIFITDTERAHLENIIRQTDCECRMHEIGV